MLLNIQIFAGKFRYGNDALSFALLVFKNKKLAVCGFIGEYFFHFFACPVAEHDPDNAGMGNDKGGRCQGQ